MTKHQYHVVSWITSLAILLVSAGAFSISPSKLYAQESLDDGGELIFDLGLGCGRFEDVTSTTIPDTATRDGIKFLACNAVVGGYTCGGPGEPCGSERLPYFRPYANLTRGQLSKIVILSHAREDNSTLQQHFTDVLPGSTFFRYAEIAYRDGLMDPTSGGPNCPTNPPTCTFSPGQIATRAEAAKASVNGAKYSTNQYGGVQQFTDVTSSTRYRDEINTGVIRELYTGYPCGGTDGPCDPQNRPYYLPGNPLTRGQFSKVDTNARFYHLGLAGYPNLIPYRGSPNYQYGAAYNPPRPDLRLIPSGQMNASVFPSFPPAFQMAATNIRWNDDATNWIKTNPEQYTPVFELTGRYEPSGLRSCPPGFGDSGSTNLPSAYEQPSSEIPPCTNRLVIGDRQSLVQNTSYFYNDGWIADGAMSGSTGRMQLASAMIACTDKGCGYDILKADLLAHFCYQVASPNSGKLIRCIYAGSQ